ncbi:MAG: glutathione S-transferase family protein [Proteobacteria bacterium]|jgi:glutathione S-transferase|nr:glutathione S-transferase family protein [Pseudomonadota bacterium]MDA1302195.1 glutathione S-transferase family protein [Pseudomonadota bacterium]
MNTNSKPVILYGVPFSQPVRAVMWLMFYKRLPFEMVLINPGSRGETGSRNPAYLAKNPGGTIPCLEDPNTGYTLGEAHAIMSYLCRRHGWDDLYPEDFEQRGRVDWYLHYHHRNVRDASLGLVAPKIRKDLDIPQSVQQAARNTLTRALEALDTHWLAESRFLVGDSLTIADMAAYVEIGQLRPEFTHVYDFEPFPNVRRWLDDMAGVEGHDDVHVVLAELGDISVQEPAMESIRNANKRALQVLKQRVDEFRNS